jgi:hypothetical protein
MRQNPRTAYLMLLALALADGTAFCLSQQASAAPQTEIHVSLFGQPCVLLGPVTEANLRTIHSLSPEQLYPERGTTLTAEPTRQALEKIRGIASIPSVLDRYRERLVKRFEAQLAVLEALENFRKTHKPSALQAVGKKYLSGKKQKEFEAQLKKIDADLLFDTFSDGIEADPEDEFHRAIHKINVQYTCSFEEGT